ncbi:SLBB domain-containing protein [bacterium]|nr:SLBB domain-containing protein [bacterium]
MNGSDGFSRRFFFTRPVKSLMRDERDSSVPRSPACGTSGTHACAPESEQSDGRRRACRAAVLTLFLIFLAVPSFAQIDGGSNPLDKLLGGEKSTDKASAMLSKEPVPVARTVKADEYVCGAGDVLSLITTMPVNSEAVLPVTADGALLLPRVGAVQIAGKTLAETRESVYAALRAKYPAFEGTLSLLQPRPILVTVQGEVKTPGLLKLTAATPVSVALRMADVKQDDNQKSPMQILQGGEPSNNPGYRERLGSRFFGANEMDARALRRVLVQHADGTTNRADIPMYEATRDGRYDPLLREGDIIVVPHRDAGAPTIAVLGAVQRPGVFDFVEGDRLSDLLRMGFGVDRSRMLTGAELTRASGENIELDISELKTGVPSQDIALQPGDRVLVYAVPHRASNGSAVVDGEVLNPGAYPVTPGKTTIAELVRMAGGFTADAYPGQAELYRRQTGADGFAIDRDREKYRNFAKSTLVTEDTLYWRINSKVREGQVAVDFHRLFVKDDRTADVPLQDGDILLIPRNSGTVYVYGSVRNSGFVPWKEGMDFDDFIAGAGGYTESADESRVAVIKGNSGAWIEPDDAVIEPGDLIYATPEALVPLARTTDILAVAAAIVGGLAGVAGLVISVTR